MGFSSHEAQTIPLGGLARKLIQSQLLTEKVASHATFDAEKQGLPLVSYLVSRQLLDSKILAQFCAQEFGLPLFDLKTLDFTNTPKMLLKSDFILKHHAFPLFRRGNRLFIAVTDPTNFQALDEIKYNSRLSTEAILVEEHKFNEMIPKVTSVLDAAAIDNHWPTHIESIEPQTDTELDTPSTELGSEDASIIHYVNALLLEAVQSRASDIHFEPYEKNYRIRFRLDGLLYEHAKPSVNVGPRLSARLKIMSRMDISERRMPQDGRFKLSFRNQQTIDFRVSCCPTLHGEKIVIRLLDPTTTSLDIDHLGLEPFQKELFMKTIHKPQGLFLVTGPTGSGKTTTLYTALHILNTTERNISSCEDPVEINLPGINQVSVNPKTGLHFATVLRSFLRQDPDVIMLGEIRDLETAEMAVKAAQTGHMVFSTLHTNSAAETLARLRNIGIPAFHLAPAVSLIIAQRLARKLCDICKIQQSLPPSFLLQAGFSEEELSSLNIFGAVGCDHCKGGYRGRLAIYEMMPISPAIKDMMMQEEHTNTLYQQAIREGMWDLKQSGLHKVKLGLTSLDELHRVIKV